MISPQFAFEKFKAPGSNPIGYPDMEIERGEDIFTVHILVYRVQPAATKAKDDGDEMDVDRWAWRPDINEMIWLDDKEHDKAEETAMWWYRQRAEDSANAMEQQQLDELKEHN